MSTSIPHLKQATYITHLQKKKWIFLSSLRSSLISTEILIQLTEVPLHKPMIESEWQASENYTYLILVLCEKKWVVSVFFKSMIFQK